MKEACRRVKSSILAGSLPPGEIVDRIGALSQGGCPEVVLTGTQLGTYGFDIQGANLRKLLIMILTGTDIRRLRVSSLQPQELDEGLLGVWEGHGPGRLAPHFHMPLQSGSDPVLNRMRRRYTASEYERAAAAVREAVPGASITTDVICGFPGETEQDHENTLALMRSVRFADAHVFPYSSRPGTSAAHYGGRWARRLGNEGETGGGGAKGGLGVGCGVSTRRCGRTADGTVGRAARTIGPY